jgi:anti-sigma factor RsiW
MIDRDSPVTEDELHVYVDGELPPDRLGAVEAWLASHPEDATRIAAWRSQADAIRARYSALVKEPVPERLALDRITRRGRFWTAIAAAASVAAFAVGGVTGWVARGVPAPPAASAAYELFTADALEAYKLYVGEVRHPVEVPGIERAHAVQWLSKRLNTALIVPNLEEIQLKLVGARLLPGPTGPAAFFMYEAPSGDRFTLYCGATSAGQTAMRYHDGPQTAAFYWVDRDIAYVLSGPPDREQLLKISKATYDQIENKTPTVAEKM